VCLEQISGYKELIEIVEVLRKTAYSDTNEEHERKLMQVGDKGSGGAPGCPHRVNPGAATGHVGDPIGNIQSPAIHFHHSTH
jgi:hypothetical protein